MARLDEGRASRTARMTAAIRHRHKVGGAKPLVFEDRFAVHFLDLQSQLLAIPTPLSDWAFGRMLGPIRAIEGEVLARSRYVEEILTARLDAGLDQVIILGAGFDTTALSHADRSCRFFEVDHPATQNDKRAILRTNPQIKHDIRFVPVDFTRDDLAQALLDAGFNPDRPALLSWLGVVMYLDQQVSVDTLTTLRSILALGSEIIFDAYPRREETVPEERVLFAAARAYTASRGEPMLGAFDSPAFAAAIHGSGYQIAEIMTGQRMRERWFAHQPLILLPPKSALFYRLVAE
jgi:methyltransferase (TIGR00027 family)